MNLEISTDPTRLDMGMIHRFLSERSYWAQGQSPEVTRRAIENSFCLGAYLDGQQVGLCRVVTDWVTFAWVADVFVLESYRGQGIGKALMQALVDHPDLGRLKRIVLATRDAHSLYARYGFIPVSPDRFMMRIHEPSAS